MREIHGIYSHFFVLLMFFWNDTYWIAAKRQILLLSRLKVRDVANFYIQGCTQIIFVLNKDECTEEYLYQNMI